MHYEHLPLLAGPLQFVNHLLPFRKSRSYLILRNDGEEFVATVNNLSDVGALATTLRPS